VTSNHTYSRFFRDGFFAIHQNLSVGVGGARCAPFFFAQAFCAATQHPVDKAWFGGCASLQGVAFVGFIVEVVYILTYIKRF
jgi:hypothetical protein